ncbi:MAG: class I SAM-dependent RNA methyltransferase [Acidimicrobiia bacterium]
MPRISAYAVCTPGLEPFTLAELERLGVREPMVRRGGVSCSATWPQLWSMNLHVRTATRVLVRVAHFPADGFGPLQGGLRRIDWSRWLPSDAALDVSVSATGSRLYHLGAIEERVREVVPAGDGPAQELYVRVVHDSVTVSLNASGEPLYRRGWRLDAAKAPLRETLAAALLLASGWDRSSPLVDPFCGSGTIPIEAALLARRMPPGRHRAFAFEAWPSFDRERWDRLLAAADADVLERSPVVLGFDRDTGAIAASRANAERAGVADAVTFEQASISELAVPPKRGWIVTNPPYGVRVDGGDVRDLYDRFGAVLRERAAGWRVGLVAAKSSPAQRIRLAPATPPVSAERVLTTNGGLPIAFVNGTVPLAGQSTATTTASST